MLGWEMSTGYSNILTMMFPTSRSDVESLQRTSNNSALDLPDLGTISRHS